jgi:hypothetical protein
MEASILQIKRKTKMEVEGDVMQDILWRSKLDKDCRE